MTVAVDTRLPFAVTWTEDDALGRSAHALAADGRVWLVDPFEDAAALAAAQALGDVAGVVQLLDRHPRDGEALAARFGVPFARLPEPGPRAGSPFVVERLVWRPKWRELALWWPAEELLVVPEAVGTLDHFAAGRRAGVHPFLRLTPPRAALERHAPRRLLVGHGPALHEDGDAAIRDALAGSLRDIPKATVAAVRAFSRAATASR